MFSLPNLNVERLSALNDTVVIANIPKNTTQVATTKEPMLIQRIQPPYAKSMEDVTPSDDLSLTIDLCFAQQVTFFEKLEEAASKACKETFKVDLPFKCLLKDNLARLKMKKNVDVIRLDGKKLTASDLGAGDYVVPIIRCTCLWKSSDSVGISIRCVRLLLVEKGEGDILPNFIF